MQSMKRRDTRQPCCWLGARTWARGKGGAGDEGKAARGARGSGTREVCSSQEPKDENQQKRILHSKDP